MLAEVWPSRDWDEDVWAEDLCMGFLQHDPVAADTSSHIYPCLIDIPSPDI